MKKRILSILLAIVMVVSLLPATALATDAWSGGAGTAADPYQISTLDELKKLAEEVKDGTKFEGTYFKLTADIGDSTTPFTTPIGNYTKQFKGNFDGDGHTVTLAISGSSYLGLFGCLNGGSIQNVTTAGKVEDTSTSYTGSGPVAGVCGYNIGGKIENCVNKAAVSCKSYGIYMGGICGLNEGGTINGCSNTAQVTAWGADAKIFGGICGQNDCGTILNCVNTGTVYTCDAYGTRTFGGICGLNGRDSKDALKTVTANTLIANCVSRGLILVKNYAGSEKCQEIGGVVGTNKAGSTYTSMVVNCFYGSVICGSGGTPRTEQLGGVVGYNWEEVDNGKAIVSNCYFASDSAHSTYGATLATQAVGSTNFQHVTNTLGMTTAQMKAASGAELSTGVADNKPLVDLLNGYKDGSSYPTGWKKWEVADGNYPTFAAPAVKIGEKSYVTLAEAIADAKNGDEIKLTQNITLDSAITIPEGKDITIDLNGFTIDRGLKDAPNPVAKGFAIENAGTLVLKDSSNPSTGKITGGNAEWAGAIVSYGTTTLEGGTITGCKATSTEYDSTNSKLGRGGAVYVPHTGTFNMSGGEIKDCSASVAGGAIFNIGTVNITGGKIDGCSVSGVNDGGTVKAKGGAVYNFATSHFTMTGGEISGNTLGNVADVRGAGVYAAADANITLGGTAKITGNTDGKENASNLFLYDGVKFAISTNEAPKTGMNVGVTTKTAPTTSNSVQIGTTTTDYSSFFFADNSSYSVEFDGNNNVLELAISAVNVKKVEVKGNDIKSGDSTVTVKDANGQSIGSENLEEVAAAINEVLGNEKVKKFDETNLDAATEDSNDAIVAALKNETDDPTAKGNINKTDISKYLNVTLVSADVDVDTTVGTTVTVNKLVFDVTPMATITVTGEGGASVTLTTEITNDEINGNVTFLLPVDKTITAKTAAVYHEDEFLGNFDVKTDGGNKYIEVKTDSFSEFGYITLDRTTAGAVINTTPETLYASLSDAVSMVENDQTITLLKDAFDTITVSRVVKFTVDADGNTNNATIAAGSGYTVSKSGDTYTISAYSGGGASSYAVELPANVKNGKVEVSPKNASAGQTVTLTVTPDKGFTLETLTVLDKNGKEVEVKNLGNNKFSFKMPSGKVTVSATFMEDNSMLNFFVDVKADDYYYDAVLWAAENGITNGVDAVHFGPEIGVTRAQVVTFLWRVAGCPEPVGNSDKFTDLLADQYYIKAVAWAIEQGITKGVTDTTFEPEMVCTRGQIVTFLARFAGVADADTESVFTDVPANEFFAAAVKWAKDNGVTSGVTDTTFEPYANCTRGQVVTFLYRWMVK